MDFAVVLLLFVVVSQSVSEEEDMVEMGSVPGVTYFLGIRHRRVVKLFEVAYT
jgi:hypothetical protein